MSEWKVREMSALLEEIRYMRKRMQVIYEACGASCGNSVHIHRCMTPESQEHEAHICEDCGYEWTQTEAALRVPGGCDCSRCQTEGCVANTYCPCCLRRQRDGAKAERDVLRKTINETEIALHKPWKYDCECCLRIGEELGAWGGTPAWETRALDGDSDE